ncbi:MAG TPA: DUF445 family protein, partial [Nitratifractor sp.]|nr:DUF445 family protein [Nitratifractor sp.]
AVVASFFTGESLSPYLYYGGLFALSGAVTNQLAIFMLFHKVPFLYGSGVIELNFERFKSAIKSMIMEQFFTKERIAEFFREEESKIELTPLIERADFDPAFNALKESVMESKFGQLITMFGGESSLEMLREKFTQKLKGSLVSIVSSRTFKEQLNATLMHSSVSEDLTGKIETIITSRLNDLGPKHVKELIERLIKEHLEWLVVWGGVFGGLIGVLSTFLR